MTNNTPDYEDNLYFPQLKEGENSFKATFDNHFSLKKAEGLDFSELLQNSEDVANNVANENSQHLTNYDILKEYEAHQTPVPSYDELQNMNEAVNQAMSANIKLVEQNAQLKELLKECKEIFDECFSPSAKHGELYKEIDEVLK